MKKFFLALLKPRFHYQTLIEVLIAKNALRGNLQSYRKTYPHLAFAPVLKSNAYGHGLIETAKILDTEPIAFLVVDSFYEALRLRQAGIRSKILIIGFSTVEQISQKVIKNCSFTVTHLEMLSKLANQLTHTVRIHLKVDTGMHRQGLLISELETAMKFVQKNKHFILEGIGSHLAEADQQESVFTYQQIKLWNQVVDTFQKIFPGLEYWHLATSAGLAYTQEIKANVVRLGLGLYGIDPSFQKSIELMPVLEMRARIVGLRTLMAGERAGYNLTFEAHKSTKLALVPAGYFEGVDRRLSNMGFMSVRGILCPIAGRVSMNMSTLDVSAIPEPVFGDPVVIMSRNKQAPHAVENIARICQTIPYEILVHIPAHLHRSVIDEIMCAE